MVLAGVWSQTRYAKYVEDRRHEASKEEVEARPAIKTRPVLLMNGTVKGRSFELVMRGFTNYFLKETWGATRGEISFLGGQKPGGYSVVIRTKHSSGQWQYSWQGTHGGGGGGAFDEYRDDMLPGRWLWNRRGFVGAKSDYEYHYICQSHEVSAMQWEEEYSGCKRLESTLIPTRISWRTGGRTSGQDWRKDAVADVVYKVRTFKFQDEPSEAWFSDQVKKYIPDYAHFGSTNNPRASVSTNR
jgi:hypothetical protein